MKARTESIIPPARHAFTLIESLAVLATIFILAVVSVPIYRVYVLGESGRPTAPDSGEPSEIQKRKTYDLRFGDDAATPENPPPPPQ